MSAHFIIPVLKHEFALLVRNSLMWFRFALFYVVFGGVMVRSVLRAEWDRLTMATVGLSVLAAVGVSAALSAEAFVQDKERGTLEALLLVPTSARLLVIGKLLFVISAAMACVLGAFLTGPTLAALLAHPGATLALNRSTVSAALLVCPPALVITGSIGTIISFRARSNQSATTVATLASMASIVATFVVASVVATNELWLSLVATGSMWLVAIVLFRTALNVAKPGLMLRGRGR